MIIVSDWQSEHMVRITYVQWLSCNITHNITSNFKNYQESTHQTGTSQASPSVFAILQ